MRILLTGCAGFIGWKTCEQLLDAGHTITGLDNLNDSYPVALKKWRLGELEKGSQGHFQFVEGDLLDRKLLARLLQDTKPDAVINLAARAGVRASIADPLSYVETNLSGAVGLMEEMCRAGVKKLVHASSSSVYAGQQPPFNEDQPVDRPQSPYAASKKASEILAHAWHDLYQLDVSVLRFFTVYGPGGRPDMSPLKFIHRIVQGETIVLYGNGEQQRDFTFVDDIARGVVASLKPAGFEIINLGGGNEPITINQMIELMEGFVGKKAIIEKQAWNPADMRHTAADITKASRLLNWIPQVKPEVGFKELADWYLKEQAWLAPELSVYNG
ncbi:NAD-dependent epimerase/dehydratase family protein [Puniceicoccales bacterium CK1056]|uniref:NAD-dependent epimerase/dehydratase family protein n=1 Tax=Oceanipulchritudo coccoides TaxID=2706888 RepID=A0A6B2M019_9BACT|nr:NAD-dependent epimerase/dehydratase family protein [Oceanipulchritudo coccoides]NDV62301.1 NAD-dependent epimerase/dehydratase family protein [Oceanipulchritudo coccoides]